MGDDTDGKTHDIRSAAIQDNRRATTAILGLPLVISSVTDTFGIMDEKRYNPVNCRGGTEMLCRRPKMRFWNTYKVLSQDSWQ